MFFKNAMLYMCSQPVADYIDQLRVKIDAEHFIPCAPSQASSIGFVPVTDEGPMMLEQNNAVMIRVRHQERKVPAGGVKEMVDERCKVIEQDQGRKVYRKERLTISDEIVQTFLPKAIPESKWYMAYFDKRLNMIIVDSPSTAKAEIVLDLIRRVIGSLPVLIPQTTVSTDSVMTRWVLDNDAGDFVLGMACELREPGDHGPVHRVKDEDLIQESVQTAIAEGKQVVSLALLWDGGISFTVSEAHMLKQLKFSDSLIEDSSVEGEDLDRAASDMAIMTGAMEKLVYIIGNSFGGWFEQAHLDLQNDGGSE